MKLALLFYLRILKSLLKGTYCFLKDVEEESMVWLFFLQKALVAEKKQKDTNPKMASEFRAESIIGYD